MLRRKQTGAGHFQAVVSILLVWAVACGLNAIAQEPHLAPPSQGVAPAIVSADSGVKSSGGGKNWSEWYRLAVGKAPAGYTIQKTEFWLTGERTCGVSAECREISKSDEQVMWEFRLQGNDELGVAKKAFSEGHIRVTYHPL